MIAKKDYDNWLSKNFDKYKELKNKIIETQNYIYNNSLFFKENYKNGSYKQKEVESAIGELLKALNDIYISAFTDMEIK